MEIAEELLFRIVEITCVVIEFIGVGYIIYGFVKEVIDLITKKDKHFSLKLLETFANGLTILMAAEIIKSVTATNIHDVLLILGIVVIRVALSILIHWEIKQDKQTEEE